MIKPSIKEAKKFGIDYKVVPISMELFADLKTTVEILKIIKSQSKKSYLLESVEGGEKWGRYSFLGFDPKMEVTGNESKIMIKNGATKEIFQDNPNEIFREILKEYKSPSFDYLPPFTGGLVGYLSYDYIKYIEKSLKLANKNDENFDDFHLMLFDKVIAFDHLRQKIFIIVNIKTDFLEENYKKGADELIKIKELILKGKPINIENFKLKSSLKPMFSKEKFVEMVEKIKSHIHEGDIFQSVISNRIEAEFQGDLLQVYRILRTTNPSPYMFYIDFGESEIAGASPETLIKIRDCKATTFALAGTCPRGKTQEEDEEFIANLLVNEKELSEHNMLVDLSRNDLGKVCQFGSIKVENYKEILKFSHVSHIATTVVGVVKPEFDQFDVVSALIPAGTLSGAPKKRACEIINQLEDNKRGTYGGAVGYIDFAGNMDMCIAIRMAKFENGKIFVQAGAGIVADSNPEQEFNECINKAKSMINIFENLGEVD